MQGTHVLYRRPPWRLQALAVLTALVLHAAAVLVVRFPAGAPGEAVVPLVFVTDFEEIPPSLAAPGSVTPPADAEGADFVSPPETATGSATGSVVADGSAALSAVTAAIPFLPEPSMSPTTRLPFTALTEARAAALPLVVRSGGGIGRRRLERTPGQIATARAESLLFARMAGIAVAEARDVGAIGIANGGVTLAIPWSGFLPADRSDGEWRKRRCSGDGDGDSDKAGEAEARRAQCG